MKVRICARQVVKYDTVVDMTTEEWETFKATDPDDIVSVQGELSSWLNGNIIDADEFEDVQAVVIGEDGKPLKPRDEYFA